MDSDTLKKLEGQKITSIEVSEYRGATEELVILLESGEAITIVGCYDRNRNDDYICVSVKNMGVNNVNLSHS